MWTEFYVQVEDKNNYSRNFGWPRLSLCIYKVIYKFYIFNKVKLCSCINMVSSMECTSSKNRELRTLIHEGKKLLFILTMQYNLTINSLFTDTSI